MRKLTLLMLSSTVLAISATAKEAQIEARAFQTELNNEPNKKSDSVLADGTLWGINDLNKSVSMQARNTSTNQTYYLSIPPNGSANISVPTGTYDIFVDTFSEFVNFSISDDDDSESVNDVIYHTFYNITINFSYDTVLAVSL